MRRKPDSFWSNLHELYIGKELSCAAISLIKKCDRHDVSEALTRFGIPKRTHSEVAKLSRSNGKYNWSDLQELYINEQLSAYQIAHIKGCCPHTVYQALRAKNIPVRSSSEAAILGFQKERRVNPNLFKKGQKSRTWKGGRYTDKIGYVHIFLPGHPMATKQGYIFEHRLVMSEILGRPLLRSEHIHHINGVKNDNRRENLELLSPVNHQLKELFCNSCTLKLRVKLLEWRVKELEKSLQYKLGEIHG